MFIITYIAINNDTYEEAEFTLRYCINPDNMDNSIPEVIFPELPENIKEEVEFTYDGVWQPQLDTIKVYEVKEVKI